jgi:hypothetical protein
MDRSCQENEKTLPGSVVILYVKGTSENLKCIMSHYNIRMVLITKYTFQGSLTRIRLKRDPQQTAHCIYAILTSGRCYTGRRCTLLAMWLREQQHKLKEGLLGKSKLAQLAYKD